MAKFMLLWAIMCRLLNPHQHKHLYPEPVPTNRHSLWSSPLVHFIQLFLLRMKQTLVFVASWSKWVLSYVKIVLKHIWRSFSRIEKLFIFVHWTETSLNPLPSNFRSSFCVNSHQSAYITIKTLTLFGKKFDRVFQDTTCSEILWGEKPVMLSDKLSLTREIRWLFFLRRQRLMFDFAIRCFSKNFILLPFGSFSYSNTFEFFFIQFFSTLF